METINSTILCIRLGSCALSPVCLDSAYTQEEGEEEDSKKGRRQGT